MTLPEENQEKRKTTPMKGKIELHDEPFQGTQRNRSTGESPRKSTNEKYDEWYNYARNNPKDTIAVVLLIIAIFLIPFHLFWGGIILGAVIGIYYADEIINKIRNFKTYVERTSLLNSIIPIGILIGLFLAVPTIFLAAAAVAGIKFLVVK